MNKPMNLRDLPAHLDKLREQGNMEDSVLVDIGIIETPRSNIFRNVALAVSLSIVLGFVTFNTMSQNITVTTGLNAEQVSSIVSDNGGRVVSIEQNEDKTYKIKVLTLWRSSFLERMRNNKDIELK